MGGISPVENHYDDSKPLEVAEKLESIGKRQLRGRGKVVLKRTNLTKVSRELILLTGR
jgi:hypothetical protein